jgi:hypothetical protein
VAVVAAADGCPFNRSRRSHGEIRQQGAIESEEGDARTQERDVAKRKVGQEGNESQASNRDRTVGSAPSGRQGPGEEIVEEVVDEEIAVAQVVIAQVVVLEEIVAAQIVVAQDVVGLTHLAAVAGTRGARGGIVPIGGSRPTCCRA